MASTTYHIITIDADGNENEVAHKTSKTGALELAGKVRSEEKVAVRVQTTAGHVVLEQAAPKTRVIKVKTPKWSRVETHMPEIAEGIEIPEGYVAAYSRTRARLVVLRNTTAHGDYLVLDASTGDMVPAKNTKETATIMREIRTARLAS